jgi:hypothetical protein
MARKPGAPLGNTNALKHGFYSKQFRASETRDLDAVQADLDSEIAMLRVVMRRLLERTTETPPENLEQWSACLSTLSRASARLATLLRTNAILCGDSSSVSAALSGVLSEVVSELGFASEQANPHRRKGGGR